MGQRIFNLSKWRHLGAGQAWMYNNPNRRMVALDVNVPDVCQFYVIQSVQDLEADPERINDSEAGRDGATDLSPKLSGPVSKAFDPDDETGRAIAFVGRAQGRDRLEFGVEGAFELVAVGGDAWVYTHDSEDIATRIVDPLIFTKIANRRERNPELEWANFQMRRNTERLLAQMTREMDRRLAAVEKGTERHAQRRGEGTPLGRPGIKRARPSSEVERPESEDRQRTASRKAAKAKGGSGEPVSGERRKVKAPPVSE